MLGAVAYSCDEVQRLDPTPVGAFVMSGGAMPDQLDAIVRPRT